MYSNYIDVCFFYENIILFISVPGPNGSRAPPIVRKNNYIWRPLRASLQLLLAACKDADEMQRGTTRGHLGKHTYTHTLATLALAFGKIIN